MNFNFIKTIKERIQARKLERVLSRENTGDQVGMYGELFGLANEIKKLDTPQKNFDISGVLRQRRFLKAAILKPKVSIWTNKWMLGVEFAGAGVALSFLLALVAYSQPGETLHTYKSAAQQFRVVLAPTAEDRAKAALDLALQNLEDTRQVLDESTVEPKRKAAALTQLVKQTQKAIARVEAVSTTVAEKKQTQPKKEELVRALGILVADQLDLAKSASEGKAAVEKDLQILSVVQDSADKVAKLEEDLQNTAIGSAEENLQENGKVKSAQITKADLGGVDVEVDKSSLSLEEKDDIINSNSQVGLVLGVPVEVESAILDSQVKAGFIPELPEPVE